MINTLALLPSLHSQPVKEKNVVVVYHGNTGRFGNFFLSFLFMHEYAYSRNLTFAVSEMGIERIKKNAQDDYPNLSKSMTVVSSSYPATTATVFLHDYNLSCTPYFQNYPALRYMRDRARYVFHPSDKVLKEAALINLQPNDIVIHFRFPVEETKEKTHALFEYFETILDRERDKLKMEGAGGNETSSTSTNARVFVLCERSAETHLTVSFLKKYYRAIILRGSLALHFYVATIAKTFIGSFGTLSWGMAFLSVGTQIHLPYYSDHPEGCSWTPQQALFIDDDARVYYHDMVDAKNKARVYQSAQQVMSADSLFSQGIKNRSTNCGDVI